ncbi:MAG: carboxypeptidase regulatory-like domain-containing protein [Chitinispirillaceae bacterium]|nr:carboxypeptidase regulatory-like domain-containing protein [Chitinispirillaceae bacterium]
MRPLYLLTAVATLAVSTFSQDISVTGTIKDTDGKVIENALIRFEKLGYVTVSTADGSFDLTDDAPVQRPQPLQQAVPVIRIARGIIHLNVEHFSVVHMVVFSLHGQKCVEHTFERVSAGRYSLPLGAAVPSRLKSGTYVVSVTVGMTRIAEKVIHRSGSSMPLLLRPEKTESIPFGLARQTEVVDVVTISKLGYVSQSIQIEDYTVDLGEIILEKSSELGTEEAIAEIEDSLFALLIERIESIGDIEGPDELKTIDFISIRNGFEAILSVDADRPKANIGYMVAALASLNTDQKIWTLADSLDAYFEAMSNESEGSATESAPLMKTAMKKGGIVTLGKVLAAKTPALMMASAQKPSFPKFITVSYIQGIMEQSIIPVITQVVQAAARVEALEDPSILVTVDDDEYEIDKGEVYLVDAYLHLYQAYMFMLCAYDMDLYAAADRQDYSWIDTLVNLDGDDREVITLSGDTLLRISTWEGELKAIKTMVSTVKYNLEDRESFMTIRSPYHQGAYGSLKAIPHLIKAGLASIKAETDDQENDLLQISMIDDANGDMLDFSSEMENEGFSASFAENFSSIEKLMDFITSILEGPYQFEETVDGKAVSVTIDLSAFFTNPVEDLRDLLPHYTWTSEAEWAELDGYTDGYQSNPRTIRYNAETDTYDTLYYFYVYDDKALVEIDETLIDSVEVTEYGETKYFITSPINYVGYVDSSYYFNALRLTDEGGTIMTEEQMEEAMDNGTFFPYFDDYTFGGVFPDMTRDKWIDLIWSE